MKEKIRVLIVDDKRFEREIFMRTLKNSSDLHLEEASNGKEAMEKIKRSIPDIVLCDLHMPKLGGMELARIIKNRPELKGIYLIMVSSDNTDTCKLTCMDEGADDFLAKPINPDELIARIRVGKRIALLLKSTKLETEKMFREIDVLLIQDGGCAPGYNPVTAFITYHLEAMGREGYATTEGFKSLLDKSDNFVRLVYNRDLLKKLDHIPGVYHQ